MSGYRADHTVHYRHCTAGLKKALKTLGLVLDCVQRAEVF